VIEMIFLKRILQKVIAYFKDKKRPESLFDKYYWDFERGKNENKKGNNTQNEM
jgi:hypothetical protein